MLSLSGEKTLAPKRAAAAAKNAVRIHLAEVITTMRELQEATKTVPHRVAYLDLYSRADRNSVTLRWRDGRGRLVRLERWGEFVGSLPPKLSRWYLEVDQHATWLNVQERIYRHAWNELVGVIQDGFEGNRDLLEGGS